MRSFKSFITASALSLTAVVPMLVSALPAAAQDVMAPPKGLQGHYVGAGVVGGFQTKDGEASIGGNANGRYAIKNTPLSVRGTAQFNGQNASIQPTVTYDLPVAPGVNLYGGGGASILINDKKSPLGDRNAFMLTAGAEGRIAPQVILYGDVRWGINAVESNEAQAISIQTGLGYQF